MTTARSDIERFLAQNLILSPPSVPWIQALHGQRSVNVGFLPGQCARQRARMDRDSKTLPDRLADVLVGRRIRSPLLHEFQDLVRALVRTLPTSRASAAPSAKFR